MKNIITIVVAALICAFAFTSCGTLNTSDVLNNPIVQKAITALEQEALQLFQDYIKSHVGAAKAGNNAAAIAYVKAELQARHPNVAPNIIHAAAASAALK